MPLANPGLMSHVTGETLSGSPLRSMKSRANSLTVFESLPGTTQVYFVKSRWTLSALNLNTFGVQLEHRRRLVPCFVVCLVYFMRECLFR